MTGPIVTVSKFPDDPNVYATIKKIRGGHPCNVTAFLPRIPLKNDRFLDIASAADIGRATLYRYFPSRDVLVAAMGDAVLEDLSSRLIEADLDSVPVPEALARVSRAFIGNGKYVALIRGADDACLNSEEMDRRVTKPIRDLLQRGIDTGVLRDDLSVDVLVTLSGALLRAGIDLTATIGAERAGATITSLFLDGTRSSRTPEA
ncbi:TetR family transcriptional regulator [Nocardia sp. SYP-A9097]|uniref:TetR/AcrR family transcriptional regulator n=1 Tax=Nocardia sp. SYP-A9097 TaxID=2663237 RepID=UPI00129AC24E|nr:TetR/AcrR family transcriptional regulator [Nocardia sp. SYP-A9097]MRH87983.1 TetR family transcriptional regulator [Nocardia sp. SYP-A9097]